MASPGLDDFVNADLLEAAYNELMSILPETPTDDSRAMDTVYEIISTNADTSTFSKLISRHSRLLSMLQDPSNAEHTVFVPVDSAWKSGLRDMDEDVPSMHISPHYVTMEGLLHMPNVPTILASAGSNGPQIVRTRFGSSGWDLNRTSHIVKCNIIARNGVIHYIDNVMLPPPNMVAGLDLVEELTTLSKAIRITALATELTSQDIKGRTFFAPTNSAFDALGEETNHFLFETEEGLPYLTALMKLHFCPNLTFFSNLIWPKNNTGARQTSADSPRRIKGRQTQVIPTVFTSGGGASITVTLARFNGLISMLINNKSKVVVQDLAVSDGVIQVIDRVLLPLDTRVEVGTGEELTLGIFKEHLAEYIR